MPRSSILGNKKILIAVFTFTALITVAVTLILVNIFNRKQEGRQYPYMVVAIAEDEIDPSVWGQNFPYEYDSFVKTEIDYGRTEYGGSEPYSKLERYPVMKRLWAGYSFGVDHDEERGHHYAAEDQKNTERVKIVDQPSACVNCHAAEVPQLIDELGWETFNSTPYNELKDRLTMGSSCSDCHDPKTMELVITRPALRNALERSGVDLEMATRQEMRSYVCAQCHVEYYFLGENKVLTFPWSKGRTIDEIEEHYDEYGFMDWKHKDTGAPIDGAQAFMPDPGSPVLTVTCPTSVKDRSRFPITGYGAPCTTSIIHVSHATHSTRKRSTSGSSPSRTRPRRSFAEAKRRWRTLSMLSSRPERPGRAKRIFERRCSSIALRSCGGISSRRRTARDFTAPRSRRVSWLNR